MARLVNATTRSIVMDARMPKAVLDIHDRRLGHIELTVSQLPGGLIMCSHVQVGDQKIPRTDRARFSVYRIFAEAVEQHLEDKRRKNLCWKGMLGAGMLLAV